MGRIGNNGRQRLIEAAFQCFAECGYEAAGNREIAARAGVAPALIHRHFGDKRGLLHATDAHYLQWAERRAALGLQSLRDADVGESLSTEDVAAVAYFRHALLNPRDGSDVLVQRWLALVAEQLENGKKQGWLRMQGDASRVAQHLLMIEAGAMLVGQLCGADEHAQRDTVRHLLATVLPKVDQEN